MVAVLEHPTPYSRSLKTTPAHPHPLSRHQTALCASPHSPSPSRSLSKHTPSSSSSLSLPSSSSPSSSSLETPDMVSLPSHNSPDLDPILRHLQQQKHQQQQQQQFRPSCTSLSVVSSIFPPAHGPALPITLPPPMSHRLLRPPARPPPLIGDHCANPNLPTLLSSSVDSDDEYEFQEEDEAEQQQQQQQAILAYPRTGSNANLGRGQYEAFKATKSRVIRIFNLPPSTAAATHALSRLFAPNGPLTPNSSCSTALAPASATLPLPIRMWSLREECGGRRLGEEDSVWAVFRSHEEACSALTLNGSLSMSTALESDLEPFSKLRRYDVKNVSSLSTALANQLVLTEHFPPSPTSPASPALSLGAELYNDQVYPAVVPKVQQAQQHGRPYQLSSNPPNPRSAFRHGDWICPSPSCAAHNFGRNVACIGCGSPRPFNHVNSQPPTANNPAAIQFSNSRLASPRFAGNLNMHSFPVSSASSPAPMAFPNHAQVSHKPFANPPQLPQQQQQQQQQKQVSQHPLLTPSGRAIAIGGKVQNISTDPLAPCIMFWPDNEPLPEQGQIRPASVSQIHHPPIMNTGNKGPIEHQPGDWICLKCEYLNWRRRKVCQTCYPYAEGNSDSVSAAMQAERIALLASVYAQVHAVQLNNTAPLIQPPSSMTVGSQFPNRAGPNTLPIRAPPPLPVHRASLPSARPQFAVNSRVNDPLLARRSNSTPDMLYGGNIVYQTPCSPSSAVHPMMMHPSSAENDKTPLQSGPLLPSFLQKEVKPLLRPRSPSSLSPSSSSSADLSFDEFEDDIGSPSRARNASNFYAQRSGSGVLSNASGSTSSLTLGGSIWALDLDEDKAWTSATLPSPDFLAGPRSRTTSLEAQGFLLKGN